MGKRRPAAWLVAMVAGLLLVAGAPAEAAVSWTSSKRADSGTLKMALPSYQFAGPTPGSFAIGYTVINFVDTTYPVFTNTGTTPASFSGPIQSSVPGGGGLPLGSAVAVVSCTVAWVLGMCPTGEVMLLVPTWLSPTPTLQFQTAPIPAGGKVYLKVLVSGFLATATVTLTVNKALLPISNTNRTAG
ncbi:hypothetical protein [Actinoplanes sp. NPDC051859]|uniref:hypothetical protein n=1 Tax=Actinoplanes sp. NPDC051859 TaxID=3363909 RepID=UPI0037A9EFBF